MQFVCNLSSVILTSITSVVLQFIPGSFKGSLNGRTIQCIFTAAGLGSSTARAVTTETFISVVKGSISNGEYNTLIK